MSMVSKSAGVLCAALVTAALAMPGATFAAALITPEEAALPPMKGAVANSNRGITRGPKISVTEENGARSPIRFQVKFQPLGGSAIDVEGVKVIYLKQPNVDLTSRIKPFVQPTGIDMPDAQLPPGDHLVRIDVKDSEGRVSTTSFVLKIAP
ncbi:MAG: hypothetical protein ACRC1G_19450 [Bradyrhizobium sp.]|nr:hypothetical protein [Bradyrhizobium sp.]